MLSERTKPVEVFLSYASEDATLGDALEKHLSLLKHQDLITGWHDRKISAGQEWKRETDKHLKTAHIILLLISPDFLASDYCYSVEMKRALERHKTGKARVIPVILRPVDWINTPFGILQALPTGAKPVSTWPNRDDAFLDVTRGIRKAVKELTTPSNKTSSSLQVPLKHFFISYNEADSSWAKWIVWQLEEAGYSATLQSWNIQSTSNFILEMDSASKQAERIIVILSPAYLDALSANPDWVAAFKRGPRDEQSQLLPVCVGAFEHPIMNQLASIVVIDLNAQEASIAQERLLAGISRERRKPTTPPIFPGGIQHSVTEPSFPGAIPHTLAGQPILPDTVQKPLTEQLTSPKTQPIYNIPYHRNPFFTGREVILTELHAALKKENTTALAQAITGLGGIGKTQTALEYAYRYRHEYQHVFWVKSETREELISDFITIATLLNLPEKNASNQNRIVAAVKQWLEEHPDWLLIFDNADDLSLVRDYLPSENKGHVLLTTRAQAMGRLAQRVELETMELDEGALFLLRRANIIGPYASLDQASSAEIAKAKEIVQVFDGLPLALDQAGAYIEETSCGLSRYLDLYQKQHTKLLKRRGGLVYDHPQPVANTWRLSFKQVEQVNPAASDLLRFCAFLAPDAIPEEIITKGASEVGPLLQPIVNDLFELDAAIEELSKYSLVRRDAEKQTITIHRLVQAVLRDEMNEGTQKHWAELVVRAVNRAFPKVEFVTWARCERCLPHARVCAELIKQWNIASGEAADLLHKTASYLQDRVQYEQAKLLHQQALTLRRTVWGDEHPHVARSLNKLAQLYRMQGNYIEAERLYQQALAIREKAAPPDHQALATTLNDLGWLYRIQARYDLAEQFYRRVQLIREKELDPEHPDVATILNDLAVLYVEQGKYGQAEPLYQQALTIREKKLGHEHPRVATTINNIAWLYSAQGKYAQAEQLYQQALVIREKTLGPEHPDVVTTLNNLAWLYRAEGKYTQAEQLYQRIWNIYEKTPSEHPNVATIFNGRALLYVGQKRYSEAEQLYKQALEIRQKAFGYVHPRVATILNHLGMLYYAQGKYTEAELYHQHALSIRTKLLSLEHPDVALSYHNLALLYSAQGQYEQAETFYQDARSIREQALGAEHPDLAATLYHLATLYAHHNKYTEAEPLYEQALMIYEKKLEPEHPEVALVLEDFAYLLKQTHREAKAAELENRAKEIRARYT